MQQINTALLSYGLSGKVFHAPFIQLHKGYRLAGAWERSKQLIQQDYQEVKSYGSLEALLSDESLQLVIVNTPTNTHFDYAKKSLEAGKHVVVEKAFTTTVEEAIILRDMAAERGLIISVFQNRRWDSDFSTVHSVVQSGVLGNIHEAGFNFLRFRPALRDKLHQETPGPGAGLLNDLGPHLIDQALSIFGMPEAVYGDLRKLRNGSLVDDDFDVKLYYGRLQVRLRSSLLSGAAQPAYLLNGDRGSFIKDRTDKQEELLRSGSMPDAYNWYTEPEPDYGTLFIPENGTFNTQKIKSEQGSYLGYYDALYKAIVYGEQVPVTADDGVNAIRIIEAAAKSNETGKKVML